MVSVQGSSLQYYLTGKMWGTVKCPLIGDLLNKLRYSTGILCNHKKEQWHIWTDTELSLRYINKWRQFAEWSEELHLMQKRDFKGVVACVCLRTLQGYIKTGNAGCLWGRDWVSRSLTGKSLNLINSKLQACYLFKLKISLIEWNKKGELTKSNVKDERKSSVFSSSPFIFQETAGVTDELYSSATYTQKFQR